VPDVFARWVDTIQVAPARLSCSTWLEGEVGGCGDGGALAPFDLHVELVTAPSLDGGEPVEVLNRRARSSGVRSGTVLVVFANSGAMSRGVQPCHVAPPAAVPTNPDREPRSGRRGRWVWPSAVIPSSYRTSLTITLWDRVSESCRPN